MNLDPHKILRDYWGFTQFKDSQEIVINAALNGQDILALLPTGGGKSICFQVPSLVKDGICIVISPLISLIQNQVAQLKSIGIKAIGLTGRLTFDEINDLLDNCIYGNYKFLYLSPERLDQEIVQERIRQMNVNFLVIDEAHCISQWGHDFRPAYLKCNILRELQPQAPMMALTATATKKVTEDIVESLQLLNPLVQKDSFLRKNISFSVDFTDDKRFQLVQFCKHVKDSCIVYTRSRKITEDLSNHLNNNGLSATFYHGGIPEKDKKDKLDRWLENQVQIIVATNAFGMGIDKPDVSLVIHYQIPDCLENYFQEAGRAGRDGKRAKAVLLTNASDQEQVSKQFLSVLPDVPLTKYIYNKLNNYFQIAFGEASNERYLLNFNEFCATYKLNSILTYNTLKILDRNSVISLTESYHKKSTVQFISSKEDLMSYLDRNNFLDDLVKLILRTYGGIFEYDTKINTYSFAQKLNYPENKVFEYLGILAKNEIINFTASHSDMELIFLVPREDDQTINRFAKTISEQNSLKKYQIEAMLYYVNNKHTCRAIKLLEYFGEKNLKPCGICDICTESNQNIPENISLKERIILLLKTKPTSSREIQNNLGCSSNELTNFLQELLEDGKIELNTKNEYRIIE